MDYKTNIISRLRAKGEVTVLETPEGVSVAVKSGGHVVTLANKNVEQLLTELEQITRHWPDQKHE